MKLRGLTYMNQSTTRLTTVQLQQRLIHAQAEVAKLKKELDRYKNDYHYSMIDEFRQDNEQLQTLYNELKLDYEAITGENKNPFKEITKAKSDPLPMQAQKNLAQAEDIHADDPEDSVFISPNTSIKKKQESDNSQDETSSWFSRSIKTRSKK